MSLEDIDLLKEVPVEGEYQIMYHKQIHAGMKALKTLEQSTSNSAMRTVGNQTVAGQKGFSDQMYLPTVEWIAYPNLNFELDGGWAVSSETRKYDTTVSHSGTRSLRMAGTGSINDATSSATIDVLPGEIYFGEVWLKWENLQLTGNTTAISFAATVNREGTSPTYPSFFNIMSGGIEANRDWVKVSGFMAIPDDPLVRTMQIRPSVRNGATGGYVWFDDIRIARVPSNPTTQAASRSHVDLWISEKEDVIYAGQEIELSNPDFEQNASWSTTATGSVKVYDDTRAYEGTRSMRITAIGPAANISEVASSDHINVTPGEVYYAECYVWWEDLVHPSGIGISLQCSMNASSNTQVGVYHFDTVPVAEAAVNSKGWVKLFGTVTVPANAATLRMRVSIREGATAGMAWFDRVRVRKVANVTSLYWRGDKTWRTLDKNVIGLTNANNTSDADKPISTAVQNALNAKQNTIESVMGGGFEDDMSGWHVNNNMTPSTEYVRSGTKSVKYTGGAGYGEIFTDPFILNDGQVFTLSGYIYHPAGVTNHGFRIQARKISDGLWGDVAASAANQSGVWEYESITHTFNASTHNAVRARVAFSSDNTAYTDDILITIDGVPYSPSGVSQNNHYFRGDRYWAELNKAAVGLSNVDNTSDLAAPISTAQQAALDTKQDNIPTGETFQYYRGNKTWATLDKAAVGLSNVNNTSDASKPISTAQQAALDLKATTSLTLLMTGTQTIDGTKTFSVTPKWGSPTVGQVWKATATDGTGSWQDIGPLVTTVDYNNVQNKPATFAPITGTAADQAAAGNHTHTKASIGLGNVDNTSDLAKPVSTATQSALNTKVGTARAINTSSHFDDAGALTADRTLSIKTGGITLTELADEAKTVGIAYVQTLGNREVGYGQLEDGISFDQPVTIISVKYRTGTADGSGSTVAELRANGTTITGTSATASASPTAITPNASLSAGTILTVYTSSVGTTPGKRLTADIIVKLG